MRQVHNHVTLNIIYIVDKCGRSKFIVKPRDSVERKCCVTKKIWVKVRSVWKIIISTLFLWIKS